MLKHLREMLAVAREVAEAAGMQADLVHCNRHASIEVRAPSGERRRIPAAVSPRTGNHRSWARQDVARAVRSMGGTT